MSAKDGKSSRFDFKDPFAKYQEEKEKKLGITPEEEEGPSVAKKRILSVELPALKYGRNDRRVGRILAVQALYAWEIHHLSGDSMDMEAMVSFNWDEQASSKAREFARVLVKGALANMQKLDEKIKPKLENWDWDRVAIVNKAILRVSLYQLINDSEIPQKVVINEAIDLGKLFSEGEDFKFINAVLDKIRQEFVSEE